MGNSWVSLNYGWFMGGRGQEEVLSRDRLSSCWWEELSPSVFLEIEEVIPARSRCWKSLCIDRDTLKCWGFRRKSCPHLFISGFGKRGLKGQLACAASLGEPWGK